MASTTPCSASPAYTTSHSPGERARRPSDERGQTDSPLFEYLEIFLNRQRRHSALGMLSPVEYELRAEPVA
ncbi:IS3 family transposase [Streptomyces sp. AF1A]|jgi:hypothetical protein|uniref:IS3 family transposase n=1 Tax=Streptomyces sp. AF1A TaxID=3394350 RepID=UPI0039BCC391